MNDAGLRIGDTELADIVRRFADARVVVVGDVMLDRYVRGAASRLSPEAPIPVLRPTSSRATLGGAANVALNVATLGGQVSLVGVIGDDAAGAEVGRLLAASAGIVPHLVVAAGRPTTAKTRFMVGVHQLLRLDEETTATIDEATAATLLQHFSRALRNADIVVLSDYAKGVLSDAVLQAVLAQARELGRVVIADPKRPEFAAYRGATVLTPNEVEVQPFSEIDAADDSEADRAGRRALDETAGEAVLVTRSAKGLTLVQRDRPALRLRPRAGGRRVGCRRHFGPPRSPSALGAGAALPEAAMVANITAGISVAKQGTATVSREELLGVLHLEDLVATDRKVAAWEQAAQRTAAWRAQGLRVGFANGCFDLIHPGHVRLLTEARARCDRLVAGPEHRRVGEAAEGSYPSTAE